MAKCKGCQECGYVYLEERRKAYKLAPAEHLTPIPFEITVKFCPACYFLTVNTTAAESIMDAYNQGYEYAASIIKEVAKG